MKISKKIIKYNNLFLCLLFRKAIGLDKFIEQCLTEEAVVLVFDDIEDVQSIHQRKLVLAKQNKKIGPNIE